MTAMINVVPFALVFSDISILSRETPDVTIPIKRQVRDLKNVKNKEIDNFVLIFLCISVIILPNGVRKCQKMTFGDTKMTFIE